MTEVNLVLKVVDQVSKETVRIISRFIDHVKRAGSAIKSAFDAFDKIGNVFEKAIKSVGKIYEFLKEAAPEAREFALALSDIEKSNLTRTVEAINRLKATMEGMFLKVVAEFGPTIQRYLDTFTTWVLTNKEAIQKFLVGLVSFIGNILKAIGQMFFAVARLLSDNIKGFKMSDIIPDPPEIAARVEELKRLEGVLASVGAEIESMGLVPPMARSRDERAQMGRLTQEYENLLRAVVRVRDEIEKSRNAFYEDPASGLPKFEANFEKLGLQAVPAEDATDAYDDLTAALLRYTEARVEADMSHDQRMDQRWNDYVEQMIKEVEAQKKRDKEVAASLTELRNFERELLAMEKADEKAWWDEYIDGWTRVLDEEERLQIEQNQREQERANELRQREWDAWHAHYQRQIEASREAMEKAEEAARYLSTRFLDTFEAIISGTEKVGKAFGRMVASIIADVGRMMAQQAMVQFLTRVIGSLLSTAAYSTQSGGYYDEFGNEFSPLYEGQDYGNPDLGFGPDGMGFPARAGGGNVAGRGLTLVGERGPELFVPPTSGNIITAARSGNNGIGNVSINVNGAGDPVKTAQEVKAALMSLLSSDVGTRQRLRMVNQMGGA